MGKDDSPSFTRLTRMTLALLNSVAVPTYFILGAVILSR